MGPGRESAIGAAILAAAAGGAACAGAPPEPCFVHVEPFESFLGPADLDDGTVRITWCADGADVTGSSFCPGAGAWRLLEPGDDPRVRMDPGDSGATAATIAITYSQFAATGSTLRVAVDDGAASLCAAPGAPVAVLDVAGGACAVLESTVPIAPGEVVTWTIDHGAVASALLIDAIAITLVGCPPPSGDHPCCEGGGAGCDDPATADCVCAEDPFCCDTTWDEICVDEVTSLGCGDCAPVVACLPALDVDFGALFEIGSICTVRPDVFEACEGAAPHLSTGGACGGRGDAVLVFGTGFPHSAAVTRCLAPGPGATLSFQYTKAAGTLGPAVDAAVGEGGFETLWSAPLSPSGTCVDVVVPLPDDGGAGLRLRFRSGSSVANGAAFDDVVVAAGVEDPAPACCEPGGIGCADARIESCVCAIDPFCCETEWDAVCVLSVEFHGCGDCGFCADALATDAGAVGGPDACAAFPEPFVVCDDAPLVTAGACAGPGDAAIDLSGGSGVEPSLILRCLDLAAVADAHLAFRYAKTDGAPGPIVESSLDGGASWFPEWTAPRAPGPGCHDACVDLGAVTGLPFVLLRLRAGAVAPGPTSVDDVEVVPGAPCAVSNRADVTGDGVVDVADLVAVIVAWGTSNAAADVDGDGLVGVADLVAVILAWTVEAG